MVRAFLHKTFFSRKVLCVEDTSDLVCERRHLRYTQCMFSEHSVSYNFEWKLLQGTRRGDFPNFRGAVSTATETLSFTDLQVLLQTPQQLSVHLASLGHSQALLLGLPQAVLQDAAVLVGAVQFPAQLLLLVHLLLQVAVAHLLHLRPQLVHFILRKKKIKQNRKTRVQCHLHYSLYDASCDALMIVLLGVFVVQGDQTPTFVWLVSSVLRVFAHLEKKKKYGVCNFASLHFQIVRWESV